MLPILNMTSEDLKHSSDLLNNIHQSSTVITAKQAKSLTDNFYVNKETVKKIIESINTTIKQAILEGRYMISYSIRFDTPNIETYIKKYFSNLGFYIFYDMTGNRLTISWDEVK